MKITPKIVTIVVVVLLFFAIIIPLHWGETYALGYFGSILAGGATVVAVFITINHTAKRQEKERKRDAAIQRLNFVSSSLRLMLSKLDSIRYLSETFLALINIWRENPQEIYKFLNEVSGIIDMNLEFDLEENELIGEEFLKLQEYAKSYAGLLHEFYYSLAFFESFEAYASFEKFIKEFDGHFKKLDEIKQRFLEKQHLSEQESEAFEFLKQKIGDTRIIYKKAREKHIKLVEGKKEVDASIETMRDRLKELYDKGYKYLLPTIKSAEDKMKNKIKEEFGD
ncbi:MAG: hypothetical protein FWC69_04010 [Defluviitaleaceae bacterium]|nr:hypothetical protein [Defluviitaleaceae bacterium]